MSQNDVWEEMMRPPPESFSIPYDARAAKIRGSFSFSRRETEMMSRYLIEEYARVARNRLPGETWAIAALRMVIKGELSARVALELVICRQERNGVRAAKVF